MKEREFTASINELQNVYSFIEEALKNTNCTQHAVSEILIASEELFTNIATYAYKDGNRTMMLGISEVKNNSVTLQFTDMGQKFNPLEKKDPDPDQSLEERKIGGLGIYIVKKLMTSVEYRYENNCNVVSITKEF